MKKRTIEHNKKIGNVMKSKWQNPVWRAQMVEKQKKAGLRPAKDNMFRK